MKHLKFWAILLMMVTAATLSGCSSSRNASDAKQISYKDVGSHKSKKGGSKKSNDSSKSSGSLSGISKKLGVQVTSSDNQKLYSEAASWVGAPYKYGGTSRSGVDCSGFTYLMYKSVYGKTISRQSGEILSKDCNKIKKSDLRAGDLVFFRTDGKRSSTPNHVGIYLKSNKFIHASSSKGVVVSDLTTDYYVKNWIAGGRVR
ncbi:MAG: C40 family peptidase [Bacteroidales bacterium]|nr:C40 family peptidase [Bacteroidales bacterium]